MRLGGTAGGAEATEACSSINAFSAFGPARCLRAASDSADAVDLKVVDPEQAGQCWSRTSRFKHDADGAAGSE